LRGEFREDLYYRLKVIEVTCRRYANAAARFRHLTGFFIDRYARRYKRQARQLSEPLAHLFQTYEWPGNIRELENMIKRIVILQDETSWCARCRARFVRRPRMPLRVGAAPGSGAVAERATRRRSRKRRR
jgi:transcriptional regulator with PAS, ATPase and Fis domain